MLRAGRAGKVILFFCACLCFNCNVFQANSEYVEKLQNILEPRQWLTVKHVVLKFLIQH